MGFEEEGEGSKGQAEGDALEAGNVSQVSNTYRAH